MRHNVDRTAQVAVGAADPGWYPDPDHAHEHRYWNGTAWTDHIADQGVVASKALNLSVSRRRRRALKHGPGRRRRPPGIAFTALGGLAACAGLLALGTAASYRPETDPDGFGVVTIGALLSIAGLFAIVVLIIAIVRLVVWRRRWLDLHAFRRGLLVAPAVLACLGLTLVAFAGEQLGKSVDAYLAFDNRVNDNPPLALAAGPDGQLWFTGYGRIGTITTAGKISIFADRRLRELGGITAGPDESLWFTDTDPYTAGLPSPHSSIGRITTAGSIQIYKDPSGNIAGPHAIVVGTDGALWFTSTDSDRIGRVTADGTITSFADPTWRVTQPWAITRGPDGNLWFTASHRIGRITTDGTIASFGVPRRDGDPNAITPGPDGNLWFTTGRGIGRATTAGQITMIERTSRHMERTGITSGPDGALWFTSSSPRTYAGIFAYSVDYHDNQIARITPAGDITTFEDASVYAPEAITVGPDGNFWFASSLDNRIGRITPFGVITTFPVRWRA